MTEKYSEHATAGEDLFLDHVHPTIESNRLLALALLEIMSSQSIAHPVETWNETAIQQAKEGVESNLDTKTHVVVLCNIARLHTQFGKFEDGYRLALRAIEMSPTTAEAYTQAGINVAAMGRIDEAIKYCRQSLQLKPDSVEVHNYLGGLLASQGKLNEAISHCRQALLIKGDHSKVHNNLGHMLQSQGKLDEALGHFQQVRRIKGDRPGALAGIARILATHPDAQKRDPKQAIALGEHAVKLTNYKNVRILDVLAMAYASEGRFDQAVTTAQKALSLASAANAVKLAKVIERRLELYKQGKPYLHSASK